MIYIYIIYLITPSVLNSSYTIGIGAGIVPWIREQISSRRERRSKQSERSGRSGGKNVRGKRAAGGGLKYIERFV